MPLNHGYDAVQWDCKQQMKATHATHAVHARVLPQLHSTRWAHQGPRLCRFSASGSVKLSHCPVSVSPGSCSAPPTLPVAVLPPAPRSSRLRQQAEGRGSESTAACAARACKRQGSHYETAGKRARTSLVMAAGLHQHQSAGRPDIPTAVRSSPDSFVLLHLLLRRVALLRGGHVHLGKLGRGQQEASREMLGIWVSQPLPRHVSVKRCTQDSAPAARPVAGHAAAAAAPQPPRPPSR